MIALAACVVALFATYYFAKRSLAQGLVAMLTFGYFYGIVKANLFGGASFFIFDSAVLGLFLGSWKELFSNPIRQAPHLRIWFWCLVLWPCVVFFLPYQHPLVALVGLRGNVFFLPMILAGAALSAQGLLTLSTGIALLNLCSFSFGLAEYFLGVPTFYPPSPITAIIYASNDVAGYQFYRIPGTFMHAHVYGGTMVVSIPWLFGAWLNSGGMRKLLYLAGIVAAMLGVLMSATRLNFVILAVLAIVIVATGKLGVKHRLAAIVLLSVVGIVASTNERFGRFKSLEDHSAVGERIHGSVNSSIVDAFWEHPMGNGLGGSGVGVPAFLQDLVRNPVAMESEYARILMDMGLPGFMLWVLFVLYVIFGSNAFAGSSWRGGRIAAWTSCSFSFITGMIGVGMLVAVPSAAMILMMVGWILAKPAPVTSEDHEIDASDQVEDLDQLYPAGVH